MVHQGGFVWWYWLRVTGVIVSTFNTLNTPPPYKHPAYYNSQHIYIDPYHSGSTGSVPLNSPRMGSHVNTNTATKPHSSWTGQDHTLQHIVPWKSAFSNTPPVVDKWHKLEFVYTIDGPIFWCSSEHVWKVVIEKGAGQSERSNRSTMSLWSVRIYGFRAHVWNTFHCEECGWLSWCKKTICLIYGLRMPVKVLC